MSSATFHAVSHTPLSSRSARWRLPEPVPAASRDRVDVWTLDLERERPDPSALAELLCPEECQRAARFTRPDDRTRFTVARAATRLLLAHQVGRPPWELEFVEGEYGKPSLVNSDGLHFNVSHTDRIAMIAITRDRQVGIDVERIRADVDTEGIARRFFAPEEAAEIAALPASARLGAFFTCFTRKEAYVKARGEGFQFPFHEFRVPVTGGDAALRIINARDPAEGSRWSMRDLRPAEGFVGALVVEGPVAELARRRAHLP